MRFIRGRTVFITHFEAEESNISGVGNNIFSTV